MKGIYTNLKSRYTLSPFLQFTLKILVSLLAILYIVYKIQAEPQAFDLFSQPFSFQCGLYLIFSFVLIFFNIGLEALKWQKMMKLYYPQLRFVTAIKAILAGNTAGIFTPNRLGEYAGRVMYLPDGKKIEAVTLTLIDRICQMLVTIWTGMFALSYFWHTYTENFTTYTQVPFSILQLIEILSWLVILLLTFAVVFSQKWVIFVPNSWLKWEILQKMKTAVTQSSPSLLFLILGLSFLRNLVFTLQYYGLMMAFGYENTWQLAITLISSIFLVKSVLPSISFSELGIRESVAVSVMSLFSISVSIAISSTFLLYLYNIALPALVGIIFLNRET